MAQNVVWHPNRVTPKDYEALTGHRGQVLLLTGLSGSGKSTIGVALEEALVQKGFLARLLDGDNLRQGLNHDLGFEPKDRLENIRRSAHVAKLFKETGIITILTLIAPFEDDRQTFKRIVGNVSIVHVTCPLAICEERDPKGLYKKARAGLIRGFTGIDQAYETPQCPDLIVDTSKDTLAYLVEQLVNLITSGGKDHD